MQDTAGYHNRKHPDAGDTSQTEQVRVRVRECPSLTSAHPRDWLIAEYFDTKNMKWVRITWCAQRQMQDLSDVQYKEKWERSLQETVYLSALFSEIKTRFEENTYIRVY